MRTEGRECGLASFVILCAAALIAGAVLRLVIEPNQSASGAEHTAQAQAVVNYFPDEDKTVLQVSCWGLLPETTYSVWMTQPAPLGPHPAGIFTTLKNGSGQLNKVLAGNQSLNLPIAVRNASNVIILQTE